MLEGEWGDGEGEMRTRVAPAFEAVAGTLTRLHLTETLSFDSLGDREGMAYELGVAVGKLRRLKELALGLFRHASAYHAVAQGLAASGGGRSLPLLWRLEVTRDIETNADLLASLLLPSVRVFVSSHYTNRALLLLACALRQAGYKHTWAPESTPTPKPVLDAIRAIVQLSEAGVTEATEEDLKPGPQSYL
jgi:hypothetical protein